MRSKMPPSTAVRHFFGFSLVGLLAASSLGAGDTRLVDAARARRTAELRALLKQKIDVNAPAPDGATALHWAVTFDDVDSARVLVSAGARVDTPNDYGVTALSLAARNGNAAIIELLLSAGANPNLALPTGETPLMTAARSGKVDAVAALLARGANVHAKEPSKGQTALMWAVADEHIAVARTLIGAGAKVKEPSAAGFTPIMFAARQGNIPLTQMLLDAGANVNDVDAAGLSVLIVATVRGHTPLAHFLLERGADPNIDKCGYTALHWASGKMELTEYPTRYGKWHEWNVLGGIVDGRLELIKALLAHGANPNARLTKNYPRFSNEGGGYRAMGATPLMIAANNADLETMRLLVAGGADPTILTQDSATALIAAVGRQAGDAQEHTPQPKALEAVRLALSLGIDPNVADTGGESAMHTAAWLGYEQVLKVLVEHGADINAKNKRGETPLRIAMGIERGALKFPGFPVAVDMLRTLGGRAE